MARLARAVEPAALEQALLRPEDQEIVRTDIPEREQLLNLPKLQEMNLHACARWVHQEAAVRARTGGADRTGGKRSLRECRTAEQVDNWLTSEEDLAKQNEDSSLLRSIEFAVSQLLDKHREVPFIGSFCKKECGELLALDIDEQPHILSPAETSNDKLWGIVQADMRTMKRWHVLWAIRGLATRWVALEHRRQARRREYRQVLDPLTSDEDKMAIEACINALDEASSMEALEDVDVKFRMAYQVVEEQLRRLSLQDGRTPRLVHKGKSASFYKHCRDARIDELASTLAMQPDKFAANLEHDVRLTEVQNQPSYPIEQAEVYVSEAGEMSTPDKVLDRALQCAALLLASEPGVRQHLRAYFMEKAVVTTEPTEAGEATLDPWHTLGKVKRLEKKPLPSFENTDKFLYIVRAEEDKLITSTMELPKEALEDILREWQRNYVSSDVNQVARQHNEWHNLWEMATRRPLQIQTREEGFVEEGSRRVIAACWGPGSPLTTLVALDERGNLVEMLSLPAFSGPLRNRRGFLAEIPAGTPAHLRQIYKAQREDAIKIRDFIIQHVPHAIIIEASGINCKQLYNLFEDVESDILENIPQYLTKSETGSLVLRMAEPFVAQVWEACAAARRELPDHLPIVRRAVALGRGALEPLAPLASLAGPSGDALALKLHPLQRHLPRDALLSIVEQVLVTAINQVGCDINVALDSIWMAALVPFVGGLGPRKAAKLLQDTRRAGYAATRGSLFRDIAYLGNNVFTNAAGTIRIHPSNTILEESAVFDPLDDSRIHPRQYPAAIQVAYAAMGRQGDEDAAVDQLQTRRRDVERVNLEDIDKQLSESKESDLSKLIDVAFELQMPYGDLRPSDQRLSTEQVFWLMIGETRDTLKPGRPVQATVRYVNENFARVTLDDLGGLEAVLEAGSISRQGHVNPMERVHVGNILSPQTCRIESLSEDKDRNGEIVVKICTNAFDNEEKWEALYCRGDEVHPVDKYYRVEQKTDIKKKEASRAKAQADNFLRRRIDHPSFQNCTQGEALEFIHNVGDAVFRPSHRGSDRLLLSLAVSKAENEEKPMVMTFEILEKKKAGGASNLSLGAELTIIHGAHYTEVFEDLDEILANFVAPYIRNFNAVVNHKKFVPGSFSDIKQAAIQQCKSTRRAATCWGHTTEVDGKPRALPGFFSLCCILSENRSPRLDCFQVTPLGYWYAKKMRTSLDNVSDAFKRVVMETASGKAAQMESAQLGYNMPDQAQGNAWHATPSAYAPAQQSYAAQQAYAPQAYDAAAYAAYAQQQQAAAAYAQQAAAHGMPAAANGWGAAAGSYSGSYSSQPGSYPSAAADAAGRPAQAASAWGAGRLSGPSSNSQPLAQPAAVRWDGST
ncbi:hypothetical protein WJX84_004569 [Apatococcus fuscideae]|uniref:Transcription elongation factor SPT6 n=1 Tax=Apatococcus fuscideae TaxID=2026836 RepID=A0AAW1SPL6_9CHLO